MRKRNRADFAPTRGWDKLNGSEQYDRMVYIQEELERRKKEREKEEEIGYNTINGRNKQPDVWNGQRPSRTMELITEKPQGGAGRETPDAWYALDTRGRLSAAGRIEGPKQQEAWIAGEREAADQPTTGRAGAEFLMADVNEAQATRKKEGETEEAPLFFPGGAEEMMEYLREHPDATLPNGMSGRMVAEADEIVQMSNTQAPDSNSKEIPSDSPDESKGDIPPAYTRKEVDELRKLLEEEGEIYLGDIQDTPYMRAINELARRSELGSRFTDPVGNILIDVFLTEGIDYKPTDPFTQEHLDALINYNKRMYEKWGSPLQERKGYDIADAKSKLIPALFEPWGFAEWGLAKLQEIMLPPEHKGRDSYEEES